MVYGSNGYKIEGILLRTQNFYMTIVHKQTEKITKYFNKIKRNLKKTKHPK